MYCNVSKTQAFPLAIRVSSGHPPRCLNPLHSLIFQPFLSGFSGKSPKPQSASSLRTFSCGSTAKTLKNLCFLRSADLSVGFQFVDLFTCEKLARPRNFSNGLCVKTSLKDYSVRNDRRFSTSSPNVVEDNGKTLPWLASQRIEGSKSVKKVNYPKNGRSSWEEAAEKFLKRGSSVSENTRNSFDNHQDNFKDSEIVEDREEDEEYEIKDDPRWHKIKHRAGRIANSRPRSDKPEFRKWNKVESWGMKTWKEATESTVPKMAGEAVFGLGPVLAALTSGRREFYALYVQEGIDFSSNNRKKKDKKGFERVLKIAEKMRVSKKEISKHDLNMVVDSRPHQGLVLDASPLEMVGIKELDPVALGGIKAPLWVALDEVTDPQNLGAIIRSSYFFGAEGVVLCAKNSAPLSGVVSKASAGSLELMELRSCKNMMQFLVNSAGNGWRVLGGSISSKAVPIDEIEPSLPTILVLGSEGTGLRPLVERSCTDLVRIPGNIPSGNKGFDDIDSEDFRSFLAVESLNVSVAAGVLLHHLTGRSSSIEQKGHSGSDLDQVNEN